jgi:IMP dehydrogenase
VRRALPPALTEPFPAGYAASQLLGQGVSYTYDDVILHPGRIYFGAHEVCPLAAWSAIRGIQLNMCRAGGLDFKYHEKHQAASACGQLADGHCDRGRDGHHHGHGTFRWHRACALSSGTNAVPRSQLGGMGFIHYNNTIEEQAAQVKKAKSHTPGFMVNPLVVAAAAPVSELDAYAVSISNWLSLGCCLARLAGLVSAACHAVL